MIDVKLQDAVPDDRLLLDSLETSKACGISRRHWLNRVREKKAPQPVRLGCRTLWHRQTLDAWLRDGAPEDAAAWQEKYRESQRVTA